MSDQINRWNHGASFEHAFDCDAGMYASAEGQYVTYADHTDALSACEIRALAAAVQRVEAIADDPNSGVDWNWDYDIDPSGNTRNPLVWIREAVAAIKNEVK